MPLNPFDAKSALLAKHAQHVVLIHFPIALYLAGTLFDSVARMFRKSALVEVARWNFVAAAVMSVPTAITGIFAWRWALEGQPLRGILRLHLLLAIAVVAGLWATILLRSRLGGASQSRNSWSLLAFECAICLLVALTAHLGGFLSGVNGGP